MRSFQHSVVTYLTERQLGTAAALPPSPKFLGASQTIGAQTQGISGRKRMSTRLHSGLGRRAERTSVMSHNHAPLGGRCACARTAASLPEVEGLHGERCWVWVPVGRSAPGARSSAPDRHVVLRHQPLRRPSGRQPLPGREPSSYSSVQYPKAAARASFARAGRRGVGGTGCLPNGRAGFEGCPIVAPGGGTSNRWNSGGGGALYWERWDCLAARNVALLTGYRWGRGLAQTGSGKPPVSGTEATSPEGKV